MSGKHLQPTIQLLISPLNSCGFCAVLTSRQSISTNLSTLAEWVTLLQARNWIWHRQEQRIKTKKMIKSLELPKSNATLTKFNIVSVPKLMVIAGSNGSGKTALLNQLNSLNSGRPTAPLKVPNARELQDKLKYVKVGFVPGDIAANSQNARVQSERRSHEFVQYFVNGQWNNSQNNDLVLQILRGIDPSLKQLDSVASQAAQNMTHADVFHELPSDFSLSLQNYEDNDFIAEVCVAYLDRQSSRKLEAYDKGEIKSEAEIENGIGKSPWGRINELFEKYDFPYRLSAPQTGIAYIPKFHKVDNSAQLMTFSQLSSGEKVLVTLVLWAFNAHQRNHYQVLLLDEFDAHLNPALAKMMMEIITETLVDEHGLQVILTTHSPSTVAFTPPGSLFWMERGQPIRQVSNSEIIPRLSDGFFAVQEDTALGFMGLVVAQSPKPILCVEGKTDKTILETAWSKLFDVQPMPFYIHDVFDCYFLTNMFLRGDIFANYPDRKFLGLLDFDAAFLTAKEKSKNKNWKVIKYENPHQVIFDVPDKEGALVTLPVPEFRKDYAGYDIANSYLSIELLFADGLIEEFCEFQTVAGGARLLRFKDKKKEAFAQKVASFDAIAFQSFRPLFDRLSELARADD